VIATPNAIHAPVAVACIERNIPVLIEKPIADTIEASLRIVAAAERAGTAVLVGHHRRHNPLMRTAVSFLRDGGIGRQSR
jgi:predicted dehydrogenase